jgi:hypothetical protein
MAGNLNQAGVDQCDKRYMKNRIIAEKNMTASPSLVLSTSFAGEIERGAKC